MPRFDDSPAYNRNPLVGRQSALQTSLRTPPCVHESGEWLRSAVHGAKFLAIALAACGGRCGSARGGSGGMNRSPNECPCGSRSVLTNGTRMASPITAIWPINEATTVQGFRVRSDTLIASNISASG